MATTRRTTATQTATFWRFGALDSAAFAASMAPEPTPADAAQERARRRRNARARARYAALRDLGMTRTRYGWE